MALAAEAKRVAAEFELTDDDVRKTVAEFVAEMGAYECSLRHPRTI
jgi:hexokinase